MTKAEVIKIINQVGEDFGWQMGKVGANYENGYMKAIRDCKQAFNHIVDSNKMIVTNADRIRNMTEEELVEYLGTTAFCLKVGSCRCKQKANNCSVCITMWLREETEVEQ